MFTFFKKDNALAITQALVKALHARITLTTLKNRLENHPDYPSMLAVSDVLQSNNIENYVVNLTPSELQEVPMPCIAPLITEGGIFALVNSVKDNIVEWWHYEKGIQRDSIDLFVSKWQGVVLLAQASESLEEENYRIYRKQEIIKLIGNISLGIGVLGSIILGIILSLQVNFYSDFLPFLLIMKFLGICVSILLLWYLLDKKNLFLKSICQINKTTNCNSILNSKAASIGNIVSWSEIGFFYFGGSFLALIVGASSKELFSIVAIVNLSALPYTIYSVYYQAIIAKKWCLLCLSVQLLLWIEFALFYGGNLLFFPQAIDINNVLKLVFCFIFPVVSWYILKPILTLALQTDVLTKTLKTFQNNLTIFKQLLSDQRAVNAPSDNLKVIEYGNPDAPNVIIVVTNPYCEACSKKHLIIKKIVDENKGSVKSQTIFFGTNDPEDIRGEVIRHFYSLEENKRHEALDSWFAQEERSYDIWRLTHPVNIDEGSFQIVKSHFQWCMRAKIKQTPTIFINNHLLPDVYKIEDFSRIASYFFADTNTVENAAQ